MSNPLTQPEVMLAKTKCRVAATAFLSLLSSGFILSPLSNVRADDPPKSDKASGDVRVSGQLQFKSRKVDFEGTNVGQENDPRKYIAGHPDSPQRAIWNFDKVPKSLTSAPGDVVPVKLTCTTFPLTKQAGPSAQVLIRAVSHNCPQAPPTQQQKGEWQWADNTVGPNGKVPGDQYEQDLVGYRDKKIHPESARPDAEDWKAANALAEKYGYYEVRLPKVLDLVETNIDLPSGLFRNALKNDPELGADGKPKRARVSIYVKCKTTNLLIGMAEPDLYLVEKTGAKK